MNSKQTELLCGAMLIAAACSASADTLKQQAEQGDPRAQYELAKRYGERRSHTRALVWLRKAADQGHAGAQNRLGVMCERGEGARMDYVEACKWYTLAAQAGNTFAAANRLSLERRLTAEQIAAAEAFLHHPPRQEIARHSQSR